MSQILSLPDEGIMKIVRQLRVAYGLKRTLRYDTKRDDKTHNESVAEHVFALDFLADYFLSVEMLPRVLNEIRLRRIFRYHDVPELKHGDVVYHRKTAEHEERERVAATEIFGSFPEPLATIGYASWKEYEERVTLEAKFAYALDKVEPCFELFDEVTEQSLKRTKFTWEDHINKKRRATEGFPVMRRFVEVISADMLARNVFWVDQAAE